MQALPTTQSHIQPQAQNPPGSSSTNRNKFQLSTKPYYNHVYGCKGTAADRAV